MLPTVNVKGASETTVYIQLPCGCMWPKLEFLFSVGRCNMLTKELWRCPQHLWQIDYDETFLVKCIMFFKFLTLPVGVQFLHEFKLNL